MNPNRSRRNIRAEKYGVLTFDFSTKPKSHRSKSKGKKNGKRKKMRRKSRTMKYNPKKSRK